MISVGAPVVVKMNDETHIATLTQSYGRFYKVAFEDGTTQTCAKENVSPRKVTKKTSKFTKATPQKTTRQNSPKFSSVTKKVKMNKYHKKIASLPVTFGKHKAKNWTYKDLLTKDEEYCKAVITGFYNIPNDFRTYCCNALIK